MNTDKYINGYIQREKEIKPNPFLSTRIMSKIEAPLAKRVKVWYSVAVAASISIVIFLGVQLGQITTPDRNTALNINDSEIENFMYYNNETHE